MYFLSVFLLLSLIFIPFVLLLLLPRDSIKTAFKKGVKLLESGSPEAAFEVFKEGLKVTTQNHYKGHCLYNMAVCKVRLNQNDEAVKLLNKAIQAMPKLLSDIYSDRDFLELHNHWKFQELIEINKSRKSKFGVGKKKRDSSKGIKNAILCFLFLLIIGILGGLFSSKGFFLSELAGELGILSLCVLWLRLSNIREARSYLFSIPGFIMLIIGSSMLGLLTIVPMAVRILVRKMDIFSINLNAPAWEPFSLNDLLVRTTISVLILIGSYFLCFKNNRLMKDEAIEVP